MRITPGEQEGREGTIGDAAGKAVNRKVHGSNPCSGASFRIQDASQGAGGRGSWQQRGSNPLGEHRETTNV